MGTLGSGNHYLEVQQVSDIYDMEAAQGFGLAAGQVVVTIHCGSRGLGHQIGTEFLATMAEEAPRQGIDLPDRELACARIDSDLGRRYLGAMWAGINCALANREIIGHFAREAFASVFPDAQLDLLYDVSHNTCKIERHDADGVEKELYVHRKGATRSLGPGHADLPAALKPFGQPVLIGGSMGTGSHILAGTAESEAKAFSSACHGAGRKMSRHKAFKSYKGRQVVDELAERGILVRSHTSRGIAEEAPGAYKDVDAVVDAAERAGLAKKVAMLKPLICIKG
jgi:tRNA-splicing ligase RtcB